MSRTFQGELAVLGTESSPAFVRAPEGNGCAERFTCTLKKNLLRVHNFDTGGPRDFACVSSLATRSMCAAEGTRP